jgi:hypothetical protein
VDPVTYPWQSSYAVFNNCPIVFIDPLGLEPEGDPNKKESNTINAPLDEVVIRAKRPSWFKRMRVNFKNIVNPSDEYKAYKNAQKQEAQVNAKPKGEYKSYGWTSEQNIAGSKFILNVSLGTMTGGFGFMGGRIANIGLDATAQLVANGFDYTQINATSVILSGILPGSFGGQTIKNLVASGVAFDLGGGTLIYGYTENYTTGMFLTNATIGLAFDRGGAYLEGMAKVNMPYFTRMQSLNYKPKVALELMKYETRLGVGSFFSTTSSKISLGASGNALQNLNTPQKVN